MKCPQHNSIWTDEEWWGVNPNKLATERDLSNQGLKVCGWVNRKPLFSDPDVDWLKVQSFVVWPGGPEPVIEPAQTTQPTNKRGRPRKTKGGD